MKTFTELRNIPYNKLYDILDNDVTQTRREYENELNEAYLEKDKDVKEVPDFIRSLNNKYALLFTIGMLQGQLIWAIRELQKAEAKLQAQKV